jgi:Flp pilus assembly protein TadD
MAPPPSGATVFGSAGEKTEMVIPAGAGVPPDQATEMMTRAHPPAPSAAPPAAAPPPAAPPAAAPAGEAKDDISKIFETSGVCPNCYATLKKGGTHCEECGYRLTGIFCPRCNAPLPDGARSCASCKWSETSPPGTLPPAAVPAGTVPPGTIPPGTIPPGTVPPGTYPGAPALGQTVMTPPPAAPGLGQTVIAGTAYAAPPAAPALGQTLYAPPPAAPAPAPAAKKGFPIVLVLVAAVIFIGILGVGSWFGWKYWQQRKAADAAATGTSTPGTSTTTPSGGTQPLGGFGGSGPSAEGSGTLTGGGEDLLQQARTYFDSGDFSRALAKVQQYLQDNPGDADAHALAGRACRALGQTEEAVRHFQSALSIRPDDGALRLELGKLYSASGFPDKAIENFREAVRLLPGDPESQWCLVQEIRKTGDAESARREAEKYVSLYPSGPNRAEADSLLAQTQRPRGGRTGGATAGGTAAGGASSGGGWSGTPGGGSAGTSTGPVEPPPPPPPSPYVTVILDGSALNLPGKVAEVTVSFAGFQQRFSSSTSARLDNVE